MRTRWHARWRRAIGSNRPHGWNIGLFHYRNHGADFGRVLVGMQVPRTDKRAFRECLSPLNYRHWDESVSPAYQLFLGSGT